MFWADAIADDIEKRFGELSKKGTPLLIRDEKTASGRVHVGSMRGVAIHGVVSQILTERGIGNMFKYEINDFDPMDGLPVYLDQATFKPRMGLPLRMVPSPDDVAPNYAEYFGMEFVKVIEETGFHPEFYRASELYISGRMDDVIRTALLNADKIREIYKRVSGSQKEEKWLPISVICERCGKVGTTRASALDGDEVSYTCSPHGVDWAEGCGYEGKVSPFGGKAKLPWKVEWPAKWAALGVHIEGAGKDHSTKGGARDVANHIAREVFEIEPPFDIPYEFFLVGGKKMSSSKGAGSSSREIADLLPPHIFRLALLQKKYNQAFDFEPEGDTIPVLFDTYDRLAEKYWEGVNDDHTRGFVLAHLPEKQANIPKRFLPRFSMVAFLVQMPHMDYMEEIEKLKGEGLTSEDKEEADLRARYAKIWLSQYAPADFKFELQTSSIPQGATQLSSLQKQALADVLAFLESNKSPTGEELHAALHDIKTKREIEPKDFFSALYQAFLGKASGPKAGWFLSVIPRDFLLARLKEVSA
jgi:lysyl-tRNA synthetase class 1